MRLDAMFAVTMRARITATRGLEGRFDIDELDLDVPQLGGVLRAEIVRR